MTQSTAKHREEARELAQRIAEIHPPVDGQWVADRCPAWMAKIEELHTVYANRRYEEGIKAGLSSRDTEIRKVLEGLATHQIESRRPCWCPPDYESEPHTPACLAARGLWNAVQGD